MDCFKIVPITYMVDAQGFNLLHQAVLKGREGKVAMLIDFAKNIQKLSDPEIENWIN